MFLFVGLSIFFFVVVVSYFFYWCCYKQQETEFGILFFIDWISYQTIMYTWQLFHQKAIATIIIIFFPFNLLAIFHWLSRFISIEITGFVNRQQRHWWLSVTINRCDNNTHRLICSSFTGKKIIQSECSMFAANFDQTNDCVTTYSILKQRNFVFILCQQQVNNLQNKIE